jgi:RHS repeat-associated protein
MSRAVVLACRSAFLALAVLTTAIGRPAYAQQILPGAIDGKVDVTPSGSASYTIPLTLPPGTAGTAPKISLTYDSQSPGGPLGAGWAISGLSRITRGQKNLRTDGSIQGVRLDGTDAIYFDGQRLIPTSPGCKSGRSSVTFIKETDDQTLVQATCAGASGYGRFTVRTKAGLTLSFGATKDSQILLDDNATILLWVCNRIEDSAGNFILFRYSQNGTGDYNVASIDYTGNGNNGQVPYASVAFNYETISQASSAFISGHEIRRASRLTSVVSAVAGVQVSRYDLQYEDVSTLNRFRLASITQSGAVASAGQAADSFRSTKFAYSNVMTSAECGGTKSCVWQKQDPSAGYGNIVNFGLATPDNVALGYRIADFVLDDPNNIARPQILYGADIRGIPERFGFQNTATGFASLTALAPPVPFVVDNQSTGALILDLDGNGKPYLIAPAQGQQWASVFQYTDKWNTVANVPVPMSSDGIHLPQLLMGNVTGHGDGTSDLLWFDGPNRSGTLVNQGPSNGLRDATAQLPAALDATARLIDVDCDGKKDLAFFGNSKSSAYQFDAAHGWVRASKFDLPAGPAAASPNSIKELQTTPPSTSGCALIVVAHEGVFTGALLADPVIGWKPETAHNPGSLSPPIIFVDRDGHDVHVQDIVRNKQKGLLAAWKIDAGRTISYAYLVTDTGFTSIIDKVLPLPPDDPVLGEEGQTIPPAYVGDLNADGYSDLIFFSNQRNLANRIFLYDSTTSTWKVPLNQYMPAVVFARQGQTDLGVRLINLHGAAGLSDVIYRQDKNGAVVNPPGAGALQNTGTGWLARAALKPPVPLAADYNLANAIQFVDADGDGYVDLLYSLRRKSGTVEANVFKNVADSSSGDRKWDDGTSSSFKPPIPFGDETIGDLGVRIADLDGDGRPDIIFARLEGNGHITSGWCKNEGTTWAACIQTGGYTPPDGLFFVAMPGINGRAYSTQTDMQLFDVDGDGLPDLVFNYSDPRGGKKQGVCLNTGTGWPASVNDCTTISVPVSLDEVETNPKVSIQYADVNGDGLVDIVRTQQGSASATYLGTGARSGSAWVAASQWNIPTDVISSVPGDPGFRLVDINGDGLPDIIFADANPSSSKAYFNSGFGWQLQPTGYEPPGQLSSSDGTDTGTRIIDLNGDGLPDLVQSITDTSGKATTGVWLNLNRRADVLVAVVDGLGVGTTICYQTLREVGVASACNTSFFTEGNRGFATTAVYSGCADTTFPILCATPSAYVARQVSISDGGPNRALTFTYSYEGLRFDALSRQSLGFQSRVATDGVKFTATQLDFNQFDPQDAGRDIWNRGLIAMNTVKSSAGRVLSRVGATWQRQLQTIVPDPNDPTTKYKSWTTYQAASHTESFDLGGAPLGAQDDAFTYDNLLNVTKSVSTRSDQTSVTIVNTYLNDTDPTHWLLGRLLTSAVTKQGDEKNGARQTETRRASFAYDTKTGLLIREVSNAGDAKQVTADYVRDQFGNIVRASYSANGEPQRTQLKTFDSAGRFPVGETNAMGHVTQRTYSPTLGKALTVTDPNKLVTSFGYDGFGRVILRTDPTNVKTTVVYAFLDPNLTSCPIANASQSVGVYTTVSKTGNLPSVTSTFDCRGRATDVATSGFGGNPADERSIVQHTDYDIYGRIRTITRPHFANAASPPTIQKDYDELDRLTRIVRPKSAVTQYDYSAYQTIVTDALGRRTASVTNSRRLPLKVTEPNGNVISYDYDAGDRPTAIDVTFTDPNGRRRTARTTHEYDSVGQRTSSTDPDLGKWEYRYNAFGNLVYQKDAKQQIAALEYDLLDRPTKRTASDRVDAWQYDTARGKGIGSLKLVTSSGTAVSGGYSEEYSYDIYGRQNANSVKVGSENFITTIEFDEYGRLVKSLAPDGFGITNSYDTSGYLSEVKNADTGKVYWQAGRIDALGRTLSQKFGNGFYTDRSFNAQTGYLEKLQTTKPDGSAVQDIALEYDMAGNVTKRQSVISAHPRTTNYAYDDVQRLTSTQVVGEKPQRTRYDAVGNITYKATLGDEPGTGTFSYGSYTAPYHGVKVIDTSANEREAFSYDGNGNRTLKSTSRGGTEVSHTEFEYSADNRVSAIQRGFRRWTFDYTAGGQLFRQRERIALLGVETLSFGSFSRLDDKASNSTIRRHYLMNAEGVFGVVDFQSFNGPTAGRSTITPSGGLVHYLHKDHLGSVVRISDDQGQLGAPFVYDAWGALRARSFVYDPANWERGYTGHQEIVDALFVHMNGRVYDPAIGSFTSPDIATQVLTDSRTFNRYSYVFNNPLKYTDPTGYWPHIGGTLGGIINSVGSAVGGAIGAVGGALQDVGQAIASGARWVEQNWKEVAVIAVAVGITVISGGSASPILVGLLAGGAAGGVGAALYGGSLNDVLLATFKGAVFGAISAGIGDAFSAGSWGSILAKGDLGGVEAVSQGGNFWQGFGLSALSDLSPDVNSIGGFTGAALLRIGAQAALSGTISELEGGKFANGAMWGAFAQLQTDNNSYRWVQDAQSSAIASAVGAVQTVVRDATALLAEVNSLPLITKGIFAAAALSEVSKLAGLNVQFAYTFGGQYALNQMSSDPFTAGVVLLTPPSTVKWNDAREYEYQGTGLALFGAYSYQFAPSANVGGMLEIQIPTSRGPSSQ